MFANESAGNYVSLKQGEEVKVTIKDVRKVEPREDSIIKGLPAGNDTRHNYYYEVDTDKGVVTVNTWALLKALRPYEPGDTLHIKHLVGKGLWEVSKIVKASEITDLPLPEGFEDV